MPRRTATPTAKHTLHVLSDSTGNLARHMVTAFLTQFPAGAFEVRSHNFLNTPAKLDEALKSIAKDKHAIVLHALVTPEAKRSAEAFCAKHKFAACDLTGSFVDFIATSSSVEPRRDVKKLHEVSDAYQARIRALEFTMEHDDGLGLDTLHEADVVLTGVSRTSKTPTCVYLAQLGLKAANVALAMQVDPPAQLLKLTAKQVVGLLIDPVRLFEVRKSRQHSWSLEQSGYNEFEEIEKEVNWSKRLFAKQGWKTLDVTKTAVEETAVKVTELLGLR
jgi:hypothetical protein